MEWKKIRSFDNKKVSLKQMLIVGGIIVVIVIIHVLALDSCRDGSSTPPGTPSVTPPVTPPVTPVEPQNPPPEPLPPQTVPEKRAVIAGPVEPWDYSRQLRLPGSLAKRFQQSKAHSGIIIELDSRRVLWSSNAKKSVPVASMTKLMTALLIMEKIDTDPDFKWTTIVKMPDHAVKVEHPSGLKAGSYIPVGSLMQSMLLASHNDSAIALAEKAANGSVMRFAARMNSRARALGLNSTNFKNANGLPEGKHRVNSFASAADICHICELLMKYERVMNICGSDVMRVLNIGKVYSTNRLINPKKGQPVPGMIGFKTGFTRAAGSCLAFGVERNGRTFIGCVTGFQSAKERDIFCRELIEWAYRQK